jgi:hypothetical protein
MDVAYDHIQEEILSSNSKDENNNNGDSAATGDQGQNNVDLSAEFQETFRVFSSTPWGMKIGGLWDNVRKQGESYYEGARQEYVAASEEAVKGFSDLRSSIVGRTRGLSLGGALSGPGGSKEGESSEKKDDDAETVTEGEASTKTEPSDGEGFLLRFRTEAAKRLKEIEKAEDAADEALLRFGTNIRNFLRDAVSIAPPENGSKMLFESKDADGRRVYHATRFEAQLHVIHSSLESFSKDPISDQWLPFKESFKIEAKTDDIAKDLDTYPELRRAMEKLVPEDVEYATFWSRYYFLRLVVETEEQKRKELLKGTYSSKAQYMLTPPSLRSDADSHFLYRSLNHERRGCGGVG